MKPKAPGLGPDPYYASQTTAAAAVVDVNDEFAAAHAVETGAAPSNIVHDVAGSSSPSPSDSTWVPGELSLTSGSNSNSRSESHTFDSLDTLSNEVSLRSTPASSDSPAAPGPGVRMSYAAAVAAPSLPIDASASLQAAHQPALITFPARLRGRTGLKGGKRPRELSSKLSNHFLFRAPSQSQDAGVAPEAAADRGEGRRGESVAHPPSAAPISGVAVACRAAYGAPAAQRGCREPESLSPRWRPRSTLLGKANPGPLEDGQVVAS